MPVFSPESLAKLETCHPDLELLCKTVILTFDCTILEGHRNEADQNKAFADGKSKLQYPNGNHNAIPSNAVDMAPYPIDWNNHNLFLWFGGYVLGIAEVLLLEGRITHSIRWGGAWSGLGKLNNGNVLNDLVHFELLKC